MNPCRNIRVSIAPMGFSVKKPGFIEPDEFVKFRLQIVPLGRIIVKDLKRWDLHFDGPDGLIVLKPSASVAGHSDLIISVPW
jgi:hypothetical protein